MANRAIAPLFPMNPILASVAGNPTLLKSIVQQNRAQKLDLLQKQTQAWTMLFLQQQEKNREFLTDLLRQIGREEPKQLKEKLTHDDPTTRWLAALVVARKRLPAQRELIPLLQDPYPQVRHAAHQALVRLGRGTDFGPHSTSREETVRAVERWTDWWNLQRTCSENVDPFDYRISDGQELKRRK